MAFIVVCEIPCFDVVLNEVRYCETVLFNTVNQFSVITLVRVIDKIIVDDCISEELLEPQQVLFSIIIFSVSYVWVVSCGIVDD